MRSNEKGERKLCLETDRLVEEMRDLYGSSETDSDRIGRMVRDATLRDSMLEHLRQLIKLRIMSEMFGSQGREKSYVVEVEVSPDGFSTRIR